MAKQKTHHALILFLITLLVLSCKRTEKELTTVEFEVVNPVTGEGYPGVPVRIYLRDFGNYFNNSSGNNTETDVFWEGVTDENGRAVHTFNAYKNSRYGYIEQIDDSYFGVQGEDFSFIKRPSLGSFEKNEYNHFLYEVVPYGEYYLHIKNIDCQGPNDKMRMRRNYLYTGNGSFDEWTPYNEGCFEEFFDPIRRRSDSVVYEIEVTKNNITETYFETFYIGPESTDTIKIYY